MADDAKLGLVAGVAAVLVIAVAYYQKQKPVELPNGTVPAATRQAAPPAQPAYAPPPPVHLSTQPPPPTAGSPTLEIGGGPGAVERPATAGS